MNLADGEQLIHEGPVSAGWGRGWLMLTDRRLMLLNRAKTQILRSMDLDDIQGIGRTATVSWVQAALPIMPLIALGLRNAIGVRLRDGRIVTFGANNAELWVDRISRAWHDASGAAGHLEGVAPPFAKAAAVTGLGLAAGAALVVLLGGSEGPPASGSDAPFAVTPAAATLAVDEQTEPESWEDPRPYFASVGISPWLDNRQAEGLDGVQALIDNNLQTDPRLQGLALTVIAAAAVDDEAIYVLVETLSVGEEPRDCQGCAASLSVVKLSYEAGDWVVGGFWKAFGQAGAFGRAEGSAVELPGEGLGFALPGSFSQGGVTETSCTVYQLTPKGPQLRQDLSKAASSDQPHDCR